MQAELFQVTAVLTTDKGTEILWKGAMKYHMGSMKSRLRKLCKAKFGGEEGTKWALRSMPTCLYPIYAAEIKTGDTITLI